MTRYRLTLEYDGSRFRGWQRQAAGLSVQASLEAAVAGYSGTVADVHGSGRTDAGVHALGQVAHFDLAHPRPPESIRMGLNYHLVRIAGGAIVVLACSEAAPDFHARFSTVERSYLYRILTRPSPPVFGRDHLWWMPRALDAAAMATAARPLVGHHDFTSYRAAGCQANSALRTLTELTVARSGPEVTVRARAPSFLYRQVRIIVGTLVEVGLGRADTDAPARALAARSRAAAGPTAPARGLYFEAAICAGDRSPIDRK
ncbi:MAG: tRNA pseudouridine(38-40) synthase TruA [Rhodospirillales bacterium]|nr:tRNA pseudouridine(38-40) synthase TruA [Rhodospirillales bacterium]